MWYFAEVRGELGSVRGRGGRELDFSKEGSNAREPSALAQVLVYSTLCNRPSITAYKYCVQDRIERLEIILDDLESKNLSRSTILGCSLPRLVLWLVYFTTNGLNDKSANER